MFFSDYLIRAILEGNNYDEYVSAKLNLRSIYNL
jgi:hypothetical protein